MAPKKKTKAPKKSKEELEEERRLQEQEDARVKAEEEKRLEEERKKRELEDAKRRELEAKNRAAELERLRNEFDATKLDIDGKVQRLAEILRAQKEARDWEKYLACEPRPDAQVEGDMNSFLNSWSLEVSTDLSEVTAACASATEVIDDLIHVAANARATNDDALGAQCSAFVTKIEQLIHDKIEFASRHVLQFADEFTDSQSRSEVKLASASGWLKLGLWVNLVAKGSRNKRIDFTDLGISVDLPKAVVVQSLALRVVHVPFDALSTRNALSVDCALGGVYSLELLALPPPPKRAHGWIMRDVADPTESLKRLQYPLDGMVVSAAQPVKVSLALPPDVIYASTPLRVGWWDSQSESWEEDGVTDVVFHADTNTVTFSTMKLTHVAVLQQRDVNHHKLNWAITMSTTTPNMAHVTLQTEHYDAIHVEVAEAGCRLVAPQMPQLDQLHEVWLPPGELLMKLAASGIQLCPALDDDLRFGVTPKLKDLEDRVIDEVVSIASAFQVAIGNLALGANSTSASAAGIKWLSAIESPRQVMFAVREIHWPYIDSAGVSSSSDNDGGDASSALLLRPHEPSRTSHPSSAAFVNVLTEVDDDASGGVKFRLDHSGRNNNRNNDSNDDAYTTTHVHLKQALDAIASPDARDRMETSNVLFEFMLQKLLRLLRLTSYSKPLAAVAPTNGAGSTSTRASLAVHNDDDDALLDVVANAPVDTLGLGDGASGSSSSGAPVAPTAAVLSQQPSASSGDDHSPKEPRSSDGDVIDATRDPLTVDVV